MRLNRLEKATPLLAALLLAGPLFAGQAPRSETRLEEKVEAAIKTSPYYGPYDVVSFEVDGDTVTLEGSVYRAVLKDAIAKDVRALPGVARVVNSIEILPVSYPDDRLRREIFLRIYRDDSLAKYGTPVAAAGPRGRGRASRSVGPASAEPLGYYAIHLVVKDARVTLYGRVDNAVDRDKATFDARGVFGVMGVENRIEVVHG